MLKIGVTGGIGAGKSLICRIFTVLGVPVYDADYHARRIMAEDPNIQRKLEDAFGPGVITAGGPDRKALAKIVFNDPSALEFVNSLVHPAVFADFMRWMNNQGDSPYIIKEAAILLETGGHRQLDMVILITAPADLRLQRVMQRDGENAENIRKRMQNQWTDEDKIPLAGVVLHNDNTTPLLPVILRLHSELSTGSLPRELSSV
jgi:dephospho-CoA kinase